MNKINNKKMGIKTIKQFIKYNNLKTYILCLALILSMQFLLSGCALNSFSVNGNAYNNGVRGNTGSGASIEKNEETGYNKKAEKIKVALENNVLYYSLKLNKVSGRKIKNLERSETYRHMDKTKQPRLNNDYNIKPSFMIGEYGIKNETKKNIKNYTANTNVKIKNVKSAKVKNTNKKAKVIAIANTANQKVKETTAIFVKLNKTAKSGGGKIALKITGVRYEGILEIISFSLSNFNKSSLRYKPLLLKKSVKNKYIEIPFRLNIKKSGNKNYFVLSGLSKINGKLICISKDKKSENISALRKTVLFIEALYKNGYGGIKFIKLPVRL